MGRDICAPWDEMRPKPEDNGEEGLETAGGVPGEPDTPPVAAMDQRTKRTSVRVSPRNGSVCVAPSSVKPLRV